jgi:hypothetical protein
MRTIQVTPDGLKKLMKRRHVTYADVARLAEVSWTMVWYVVNGQKTSAKVMAAIARLVGVEQIKLRVPEKAVAS